MQNSDGVLAISMLVEYISILSKFHVNLNSNSEFIPQDPSSKTMIEMIKERFKNMIQNQIPKLLELLDNKPDEKVITFLKDKSNAPTV